jgi:hypothetical protein
MDRTYKKEAAPGSVSSLLSPEQRAIEGKRSGFGLSHHDQGLVLSGRLAFRDIGGGDEAQ